MCHKLLMHFFASDRKVTYQIFVLKKKHEKTFSCFEISHTKEAEVLDTFQWGWVSDTILNFFKVEVLLPIDQNQNNTQTSQILLKWCQNCFEGIKVLDDNFDDDVCKTADKNRS